MFGEEDIVKSHEERSNIISLFIIAAFGLIIARLCYLQIYKGDLLLQYSVENRLREEIIRAPRGVISSRDGKVLVNNHPRFDAIVTRQYLDKAEKTLNRLSQILSMPVENIKRIIKKNSFQAAYRPIVLKKNLTMEEVALIETENEELSGVSVDVFISREYMFGEVGAHILGYISEITQDQLDFYNERDRAHYRLGDFMGQFGLEKQFDKFLRGVNGSEYVEVDALGRKKKNLRNDEVFKAISDVPSIPGNNMVLTLDSDMQNTAHQELQDRVGAVVALDVNTGEILTMVSHPAFQPSEFSKGIQKEYWDSLVKNINKPLRDRGIQEHYSPGSTFKPFTAMALLTEKVFDENTEISCTGGVTFGSKTYHCWKEHGHGIVNLRRAIRESCNSYFQKAAIKLDIDSIASFAKMFGLGEKTGVDLPRETSGLIPTKDWKMQRNGREWQKGETLSCAIGQSYVLVTMMQMAVAYGAIANGGHVMRPFVVKEISKESGELVHKGVPEVVHQANVNPKYLKAIQDGLYQVVNHPSGTAFSHRGEGLDMAGKTGTSQVMGMTSDKVFQKCEDMPYDKRHHGLFIGYLPAHNPKIAIAALVEHGCHGSSSAAPIVAKVGEVYLKKYMPAEYKKNVELQKQQVGIKNIDVNSQAEDQANPTVVTPTTDSSLGDE